MYCGVLIRSVYNEESDNFIDGPCKSVNDMLNELGHDDVASFMKNKNKLNIYDTNQEIYIEHKNDLDKHIIYKATRIGLSDKYPDFQSKEYRYAIMTENIKKEKKKFKLCTK